jgi:urease accessory protein
MTSTVVRTEALVQDSSLGARMQARAVVATQLVTDAAGCPRTRICGLRSEAPFFLRPTIGKGAEPGVRGDPGAARVTIAAGAAGPVGGDRLELTVFVGAGSTLVLTEASSTLLLPGRDGAPSRTDVDITVEAGGTLVWLPEPVIAAHGCDHVMTVRAKVARDARLLARDEILLGRHDETPGLLRTRWRVYGMDGPLLAQDLELGTRAGRSAAVVGAYRALGSLVVVTPEWASTTRASELRADTTAYLPLGAGTAVVSALADDSRGLRNVLDDAMARLGPPWEVDEGEGPDPRQPRRQQ